MKFRPFFFLACVAALQSPVFSDISFFDLLPEELSEIVEECVFGGFNVSQILQLKTTVSLFPSFISSHTFKKASFRSNVASLCRGQGMLQASLLLKERLGLSIETVREVLESIEIDSEVCQEVFADCIENLPPPPEVELITLEDGSQIASCANYPYRMIDGYCNNVVNREFGMSFRPFNRLLPPVYDDGIDAPRGSILDNLPNPRLVSQTLMEVAPSTIEQQVSQMVKAFGQFLDHDLTRTPEASAGMSEEGETLTVECCEDGEVIEESFSPECIPIYIPRDDTFFTDLEIECLPFVRSIPADSGCRFGPREQINEVTAFLDGSNVYGSTTEEELNLRALSNGLLATSTDFESMPTSCSVDSESLFLLPPGESEDPSFRAGDIRVNEQPSLAAMHTAWVRVHNKIASTIIGANGVNGNFDDEVVFQNARRIVGALLQHITYNEFLPLVIGDEYMRSFGLYSQNGNRFNNMYDPFLNPTIFNTFGTSAFRFGHTLITDRMSGFEPFLLGDNFFTAGSLFREDGTQPSSILEMEARMQALPTDVILDDVLTTRLAVAPPENLTIGFPDHGSDLMALNIMRGRDHGLPSYNAWRQFCGLPIIQTLVELKEVMDPNAATEFFGLYRDVDDIDIFPAGLAENATDSNGILGPTFSCMIATQFFALKYGDRFFYENSKFIHNNNQDIAFTRSQLRIIKSSTFAEILCEVTCSEALPVNVFRFDEGGDEIICGELGTRSLLFTALEQDVFFR